MNKPSFLLLLLLVSVSFLQMGAILKKDDPVVAKTQTKGIGYKEKMEEIKDGEKAPPQPSWKFYPHNKFLTESPVEIQKQVADKPASYLPGPDDAIPEDLSGLEDEEGSFNTPEEQISLDDSSSEENEDTDWWGEEESSSDVGNDSSDNSDSYQDATLNEEQQRLNN